MVADNYVNNTVKVVKPTLAASEVKTLVDNWPAKQAEYQLVSVTSAASYAIGHVPNAINIPWQELAKPDNLSKLDPAKTLIVSSDIGHAGQMASTVLNLLGYKASNLKFGMMDWNLDTLQARGVPAWNSAASTHPVTVQ
jgi:rhodanese-related sulfurtransferase